MAAVHWRPEVNALITPQSCRAALPPGAARLTAHAEKAEQSWILRPASGYTVYCTKNVRRPAQACPARSWPACRSSHNNKRRCHYGFD
ncbi:hypothetical protein [Candidatus Electronema sp. TJ]|uniref:hypothetical protein n=1 Tax=Candidatus Electronema sp. TJ TaxID=3401573 RepID=UPI003AA870C8